MAKLIHVVEEFLAKRAGFEELRAAYQETTSGPTHKFKRNKGVPGLYELCTCIRCGASVRVPARSQNKTQYTYSSAGGLGPCNMALVKDIPAEFYPAYDQLSKVDWASLVDISEHPAPVITIGNWGVPALKLGEWEVALDQKTAAIWKSFKDGCGCGNKHCRPRVRVSKDETITFVTCGGLILDAEPEYLKGWQSFQKLAVFMYKLSKPYTLLTKWYGTDWQKNIEENRRFILRHGKPLKTIWGIGGDVWIAANPGHLHALREISEEEYSKLIACNPALVRLGHNTYFEVVTLLVPPKQGAKVHFQTGHISSSTLPFEAAVYRGTFFPGAGWKWEVSGNVRARDLEERVLWLLDEDYTPCDQPQLPTHSDWIII